MLDQDGNGEATRVSRCIRCDRDGFPCLVDAKADSQVVCVDPALDHPNVTSSPTPTSSGSRPTRPGAAVTGVVARVGDDTTTLLR